MHRITQIGVGVAIGGVIGTLTWIVIQAAQAVWLMLTAMIFAT